MNTRISKQGNRPDNGVLGQKLDPSITFMPILDVANQESPAPRKRTRQTNLQAARKACNECRQQKVGEDCIVWTGKQKYNCQPHARTWWLIQGELQLRCDAIQEPYSACSRCLRLKIDCKTDSTFRRVQRRKSVRRDCTVFHLYLQAFLTVSLRRCKPRLKDWKRKP